MTQAKIGKIDQYILDVVGGAIRIQGNWNALTNSPDISGTTIVGYAWIVSVAGTTNLGGITSWQVGDLAVKTDSSWAKIDNQDYVTEAEGDIRYVKLDQTKPQTIVNGAPIFNAGLKSNGDIILKAGQKLIFDGA